MASSRFCLLISCFFFLASCNVIVKETWKGGFLADLVLHAPQDLHGWKLHVVFSTAVDSLNVWDAIFISSLHYKTEYVLTNQPYNKDLQAGEELKMEIDVQISTKNTPTAYVYFEGFKPGTGSHPTPSTGPSTGHTGGSMVDNYPELLDYSIRFYEAQRSGKLPHNNRIPWRGDSALGDKGDNGHDLTGGWYDAGDHVKFNFPMSASVTWLTWGLLKFKDAYSVAGQLDHMYSCIRWPLDYFLKCWVPAQNVLYVQVGSGKLDHNVWGRAEDMTMARPASKVTTSKPGSDVAGQMAAAMAAGSIAFKTKDHAYSVKLLTAAKSLYKFAKDHRGKYSDSIPAVKEYYESTDYHDELALAAAWLYKATRESHYLNDAKHFVPQDTAWALDWDDTGVATQMLLYEETHDRKYAQKVEDFMTDFMPGGTVPYTPCGLVLRQTWGPLSFAGNTAMLALIAADAGLHSTTYRAWAAGQIHYMLGENKYKMSYVVGYGTHYPLRPHHAGSSCPNPPTHCDWNYFSTPSANPHVLYGAVVGGPDAHDNYKDARDDYIHNEVACDYNAGFQSAVAGLLHLQTKNQLPQPSLRGCN